MMCLIVGDEVIYPDTLVKVVFARFLKYKVIVFLFVISVYEVCPEIIQPCI